MNILRTKSIKVWAIVLILLMCLTSMTIFGFIASQSIKQNIELQYKQESEYVLNQTVTSFENSFLSVENFLEQLEQTLIFHPMSSEELETLFYTYQSIMPSNSSLIYGYLNGQSLYWKRSWKFQVTLHHLNDYGIRMQLTIK